MYRKEEEGRTENFQKKKEVLAAGSTVCAVYIISVEKHFRVCGA
jgi:hypothetical protein